MCVTHTGRTGRRGERLQKCVFHTALSVLNTLPRFLSLLIILTHHCNIIRPNPLPLIARKSIGVLYFMFRLNWHLSLATFVSVPLVIVISKFYGDINRTFSKKAQKRLANANALSDEAFSSMMTVRAFGAEHSEGVLYARKLERYVLKEERSERVHVEEEQTRRGDRKEIEADVLMS